MRDKPCTFHSVCKLGGWLIVFFLISPIIHFVVGMVEQVWLSIKQADIKHGGLM